MKHGFKRLTIAFSMMVASTLVLGFEDETRIPLKGGSLRILTHVKKTSELLQHASIDFVPVGDIWLNARAGITVTTHLGDKERTLVLASGPVDSDGFYFTTPPRAVFTISSNIKTVTVTFAYCPINRSNCWVERAVIPLRATAASSCKCRSNSAVICRD